MSAAAPTPEPTGLSESQRRVLDELAAHENAADPGYVLRMNAPVRPAAEAAPDAPAVRARRRDLLIQLAVVGAIVALVLPLEWTVALLLTIALVVGPTYLVLTAMRHGGLGPAAPKDPDAGRPD